MKIEDLHYGDVLQSSVRPQYRIMFLGRDGAWSLDREYYGYVVSLGGASVLGSAYTSDGSVGRMHAAVFHFFSRVENGPEPLGMGGYRR